MNRWDKLWTTNLHIKQVHAAVLQEISKWQPEDDKNSGDKKAYCGLYPFTTTVWQCALAVPTAWWMADFPNWINFQLNFCNPFRLLFILGFSCARYIYIYSWMKFKKKMPLLMQQFSLCYAEFLSTYSKHGD